MVSAGGIDAVPRQPVPPGCAVPATRCAVVPDCRIQATPTATLLWPGSGRNQPRYSSGTPWASVCPGRQCASPGSGVSPAAPAAVPVCWRRPAGPVKARTAAWGRRAGGDTVGRYRPAVIPVLDGVDQWCSTVVAEPVDASDLPRRFAWRRQGVDVGGDWPDQHRHDDQRGDQTSLQRYPRAGAALGGGGRDANSSWPAAGVRAVAVAPRGRTRPTGRLGICWQRRDHGLASRP